MRKETRCRHIGYSYRLTARVLLYAPSHRQNNTYHCLCYTSRGALAGTRHSSMGPPHEGSIRRPIAPGANALPLSYVPLLFDMPSLIHLFQSCPIRWLACRTSRQCIHFLKRCDCVNDCPDSSDEDPDYANCIPEIAQCDNSAGIGVVCLHGNSNFSSIGWFW